MRRMRHHLTFLFCPTYIISTYPYLWYWHRLVKHWCIEGKTEIETKRERGKKKSCWPMSRSRSHYMSWWEKNLISKLMKSVNAVCVRCVCLCLQACLWHSHILRGSHFPAASSGCCAILHHWCGELVLCYCCLPPSFPIPDSSSTWLSTQLQWSSPSTPPLAACICIWLGV